MREETIAEMSDGMTEETIDGMTEETIDDTKREEGADQETDQEIHLKIDAVKSTLKITESLEKNNLIKIVSKTTVRAKITSTNLTIPPIRVI